MNWDYWRRKLPFVGLLLLMAAGWGVRAHYARMDDFPSVDGVFYLEQSRELVLENRLPFDAFPPGWPVLVSLPLSFFDANDPAQVFKVAQGTNILLSLVWAGLAFFLLRRDLGPWLALAGAGILLALPLAIISAKGDLSEMSYGCVLLLFLLVWPRDRFQAGLALGMAYLIRPEALLIALALGIWVAWRERRAAWGMALGTMLCVVPYVIFIQHHTGVWALSGKMGVLEVAQASHRGGAHIDLILGNLGTFLSHLPRLLGFPLVLLALIGGIGRPRWAFVALLALVPLPLFDFVMAERFWLPYLPLVLLAAGLGGRMVCEAVSGNRTRALAGVMALMCLAGVSMVSGDGAFWMSRNSNAYPGMRDAGHWLAPKVTSDTRIAAYKPFSSYWAGCEFVKYPADLATVELIGELRAKNVEFLVVNFHVARLLQPQLKPLLEQPLASNLADKVRVLKVFDYTPDDHTTVVFSLLPIAGS